jgi:hypothetical protein
MTLLNGKTYGINIGGRVRHIEQYRRSCGLMGLINGPSICRGELIIASMLAALVQHIRSILAIQMYLGCRKEITH